MTRTTRRRATTALQFAFVAPVFFGLIIGIIEISRGFMCIHLLANAARAGCRQGVLASTSTATITSTVNSLLTSQGVNGTTTTVKVNGVVADASTAVSNDQLNVTVSVPVANVTWLPGAGVLKGTITSQFTLRRE